MVGSCLEKTSSKKGLDRSGFDSKHAWRSTAEVSNENPWLAWINCPSLPKTQAIPLPCSDNCLSKPKSPVESCFGWFNTRKSAFSNRLLETEFSEATEKSIKGSVEYKRSKAGLPPGPRSSTTRIFFPAKKPKSKRLSPAYPSALMYTEPAAQPAFSSRALNTTWVRVLPERSAITGGNSRSKSLKKTSTPCSVSVPWFLSWAVISTSVPANKTGDETHTESTETFWTGVTPTGSNPIGPNESACSGKTRVFRWKSETRRRRIFFSSSNERRWRCTTSEIDRLGAPPEIWFSLWNAICLELKTWSAEKNSPVNTCTFDSSGKDSIYALARWMASCNPSPFSDANNMLGELSIKMEWCKGIAARLSEKRGPAKNKIRANKAKVRLANMSLCFSLFRCCSSSFNRVKTNTFGKGITRYRRKFTKCRSRGTAKSGRNHKAIGCWKCMPKGTIFHILFVWIFRLKHPASKPQFLTHIWSSLCFSVYFIAECFSKSAEIQ